MPKNPDVCQKEMPKSNYSVLGRIALDTNNEGDNPEQCKQSPNRRNESGGLEWG